MHLCYVLFTSIRKETGSTGQYKRLIIYSRQYRERMEENEQQNLAIMLMAVVAIFVLCNVLAMVANILDALNFSALALTQVKEHMHMNMRTESYNTPRTRNQRYV